MKVIFDTSVLSNFALSESLFIIKKLYANRSFITEFVRAEIQRGINCGYEKLNLLKIALDEGWLKEIILTDLKEKILYEKLSISLGIGEASSIAIAKLRGFVFACD